jgi:hypothetical protein
MNHAAGATLQRRRTRFVAATSPKGSLWLVLLAAIAGSSWSAGNAPPALDPLMSTAWLDPAVAPVESFRLLPGIGPRLAERIGRMRSEGIDFESVEDLQQVPGIGVHRLEAIRPFIRSRAKGACAGSSGQTGPEHEVAPPDRKP